MYMCMCMYKCMYVCVRCGVDECVYVCMGQHCRLLVNNVNNSVLTKWK